MAKTSVLLLKEFMSNLQLEFVYKLLFSLLLSSSVS